MEITLQKLQVKVNADFAQLVYTHLEKLYENQDTFYDEWLSSLPKLQISNNSPDCEDEVTFAWVYQDSNREINTKEPKKLKSVVKNLP